MGAHSTIYNVEGLEFKGVFIPIAPNFFSKRILCENLFEWIYSVENGSCSDSFYGFAVQQREGS